MRSIAGIYKAYDIRGTTDQLSEALAYDVGRSFVRVTKAAGKTLVVGHDMRPTSPAFARQVIRGMTDEGASVVDVGLVSTPLFYFAAGKHDGGCMVTASHNPPEYNGFKFVRDSLPVSYKNGIAEMEAMIPVAEPPGAAKGGAETHDYLEEFLKFNLGFLTTTKDYVIVVDAANGMGGYTYEKVQPFLEARGITVVPMYYDLDGTFPNHEANPLKTETLDELKARVRATEGVTLGLALDGDGDRCVFIDETGEHITSDLTLGLVAEQLLDKAGGGAIIHDLRCSRSVRELIEEHDGKAVPSPVGYASIKPMAKEHGALFGGEISGHFFPAETGYNENTMFMLFQVLNLIERSGKTLGQLVAPLKKYASSGEINSEVADADATLAACEERYAPGAKDVSHLDGVRVEFPTWWFSLRKSNTEPVVRLIVEADTVAQMEAKRDELLALIRG